MPLVTVPGASERRRNGPQNATRNSAAPPMEEGGCGGQALLSAIRLPQSSACRHGGPSPVRCRLETIECVAGRQCYLGEPVEQRLVTLDIQVVFEEEANARAFDDRASRP